MAEKGTDIHRAADILKSGRLVAIPTETVYGLAGNALDPEASALIFETKNRPSFDPLIVHVGNTSEVRKYTSDFPVRARKLAEAFWPGPLTLLLPKSDTIPDIVTSGMPDVAIRIPSNAITLELLNLLPFPLVAPSANPFGYISPTNAQHVEDQLGSSIEYILDSGPCSVGLESTIVGFPEGIPTIFRQGGLVIEEIEKVIGSVQVKPHSSSNPRAPGMLKSHYAPRCPIRLLNEGDLNGLTLSDRDAVLAFKDIPANISDSYVRVLAPDGNMHTAAKNLFRYMRELDELDIEAIYAVQVPDIGLGKAINDRLRRAAAPPS